MAMRINKILPNCLITLRNVQLNQLKIQKSKLISSVILSEAKDPCLRRQAREILRPPLADSE